VLGVTRCSRALWITRHSGVWIGTLAERTDQDENKQPAPIRLTDADVAGLLARMEVQQADMERLEAD
jgi:hypothetical protein